MSTANSHVTFVESAPFVGDGFRIDTTAGVVYGAAICGFLSKNKRRYPAAVLARDHKKYEGAAVNLNHFDGERQVSDYLGRLENVRIRPSDGKPVGDIKYVKNKPFAKEFEERVTDHPNSFGLSHVAVCATKRVNGEEVIESLGTVLSVDLVANPATNTSLFESHKVSQMDETEKALREQVSTLTEVSNDLKKQVESLTAERDALKASNEVLTKESDELKLNAVIGGVKLTEAQRKAVRALPDEAERKEVVESFRLASEGQKVTSGGRGGWGTEQDSKALSESVNGKEEPITWVE